MNPNFKPEMITPKLLKACEEQVQKYFGEREVGDHCLICSAIPKWCDDCPLSTGTPSSCVDDPTYISIDLRSFAPKEQLLARGNRLIEILDEHGITIYDKWVKR